MTICGRSTQLGVVHWVMLVASGRHYTLADHPCIQAVHDGMQADESVWADQRHANTCFHAPESKPRDQACRNAQGLCPKQTASRLVPTQPTASSTHHHIRLRHHRSHHRRSRHHHGHHHGRRSHHHHHQTGEAEPRSHGWCDPEDKAAHQGQHSKFKQVSKGQCVVHAFHIDSGGLDLPVSMPARHCTSCCLQITVQSDEVLRHRPSMQSVS